ncbi:FHF complex subunit HOOK interacting protein 1B [Pangasianodon hypophthalmus]|uniref:FHF complex subunit HOOK interacting protein 1B n=1 Tax=Pangasianodon hypophthalmus TaxID=310915 RepID=UPI00230833E5|nr:FHF complex subunit HOOK interacting protein 1B [Pangasianodon hypophthalmus]XP_034160353.2 FHF complex subunit HOOK interacting protein 1B [Pangasianodon hypophthalmus]XP_034160354.2 FHF complex subunit HOOK interacting protein 1B [Pangasianodon hypophthalmus]XP_034160355.2 FHF complex subunit HOOK interacting protein 1B [Pangasianodon hypophthalmus]
MSWLSRITPRGPDGRNSRNVAPSSPCTADPETCLMVFENHWRQVSWVLEQRDSVAGGADDLTAVRNHTDQMLCLLAEERPAGGDSDPPALGPILELVVSENILERLVQWHVRRGLDPDSQTALLKLFEMLIGQSHQPLLQNSAVLQPLLILLGACVDPQFGCPPNLEASLVLLLNQVCVSMARQPAVLELLFRCGTIQQGPTNLLIFSLLVPFIHRDGVLGQQARDALLLVMATSASNHAVARYITENSYFCPVLATGLSALYSSLPRKIEVRDDDWHALQREDWMGVSSLVLFMNSLEFCNAVVQVAHPLVRYQLIDYLHNGFLVPVMGPALHKSSVDEMIASTAYLDLFLRSVTEKSLLKTFLRFILLHRHDNDTILDTLLTRISSNSRLCMVSLSLFKTLLSLNCEDLMLQLVLRYLLPCTHVMLSQRRAVRETDLYGKSADKFLSLIPECCRITAAACNEKEEEPAFWGKVLGSPTSESPIHAKPSTPSRLALFIRQQNTGNPSSNAASDNTPSSPRGSISTPSPHSPMHQPPDALEAESGYLEYLRDARRGIELCSWACRDWSAPYDGENPSPNSVPPPPQPPTSNPSLNMVPEHFSMQQSGLKDIQQRAAIVAAARAEWSSSDRNSGEWDVTISKNCISLTPRSKKRSLLPSSVSLQPSSSSSSSLLSSSAVPPLGPGEPAGRQPHTVPHRALYNGTGQADECVDMSDRGMEVKKVKRDADANGRVEELNVNGRVGIVSTESSLPLQGEYSLVTKPSQVQSTALPQPQPCPANLQSSSQECNSSEGQRSTPALSSTETFIATSCSSPGLESVESLIDELLEQAPSEPLSEDSNGKGISIEAFHQELRELEERVKGRRVHKRSTDEFIQDPLSNPPDPNRTDEECPSLETEQGAEESKPESSTPSMFSPARPLGQPQAQPYIGPFLTVLFSKLENMMQNSLYVNILLTGIVFQLACYPQPLLRSFLLNTNMVFQPSVKSLIQVLGSVKNRIEAFAAVHEDFPAMLRKARRFLVTRGKLDWTDSATGVPPLRRSDSMVKSRKPSLGELILRHTNSPTRARHAAQAALAHVRDGGHSLHSALFRGVVAGTGTSSLEKQAEALRVKNTVYCAVIFSEFLKELAALAQEHAVAMPFPPSQGTEE